MSEARAARRRGLVATAILLSCLVGLTACAFPTPGDAPDTAAASVQLETELNDDVDIANGVFVASSSSGVGNATVLVRLYVDSDETAELADAVDEALKTTWTSWPQRPSAIQVEVVVGQKPADAGRLDTDTHNLEDVAEVLDIEPKNVHVSIRLSSSLLIERYGE